MPIAKSLQGHLAISRDMYVVTFRGQTAHEYTRNLTFVIDQQDAFSSTHVSRRKFFVLFRQTNYESGARSAQFVFNPNATIVCVDYALRNCETHTRAGQLFLHVDRK